MRFSPLTNSCKRCGISTGRPVEIPQRLQEFVKGEKRTVALGAEFEAFKEYLLSR